MGVISFDIGEKNFAYCIGNENGEIKKIAHHNIIEKKRQTIIESCISITKILENEEYITNSSDISILIEQQMRANVRAQRLSQHLWSYFNTKYPNICIKFIPSHLKTQYFLGKNNLDNKSRKKWSVAKTKELLNKNQSIVDQINNLQKQDDVCDTILQLFAHLKIDS